MGSGRQQEPSPADGNAGANVEAALMLLHRLMEQGLRHLVLCPGSRSAPLAVAAALLEPRGLRLHTAIDERSAAFFALGLGRGGDAPAAVVTTSGTAVAQLLAACVEADLGTVPLLLLTADRPARLKNCGANQAVPQEHFLRTSCRRLLEGPPGGLARCSGAELEGLARAAMAAARGDGLAHPAGPVHLNLPFEEPIHAGSAELAALHRFAAGLCEPAGPAQPPPGSASSGQGSLRPRPLASARPPAAERAAARADGQPLPSGDGGRGQPGGQVSRGDGGADLGQTAPAATAIDAAGSGPAAAAPRLDPQRPGVVVAGPWRGSAEQWPGFCRALRQWLRLSGWPLLADALSGLRGLEDLPLISAYDLVLEEPCAAMTAPQVLRLGSLPASRRLERWLQAGAGRQVLISQGDPRRLDPLGTVPASDQWSGGLEAWLAAQGLAADGAPVAASGTAAAAAIPAAGLPTPASRELNRLWQQAEASAQRCLDRALACLPPPGAAPRTAHALADLPPPASPDRPAAGDAGPSREAMPPPAAAVASAAAAADAASTGSGAVSTMAAAAAVPAAAMAGDPPGAGSLLSEPWLARRLSQLLPPGLPLMLASSSPVRDWESFADPRGPWRPIHGFRGASGIDGTLSIACGLAEALGRLVLVSGDLALLHDANGWLWSRRLAGRLTVVLIENGGGGIFEQLPIRSDPADLLDFERLFAMPQAIDQLALAALHGVPGRRLHRREDLEDQLAWALEQPIALLEVRSERRRDAALRRQLRLAVGRENGPQETTAP